MTSKKINGKTWIGPEEDAYVTRSGGHTGSRRKGYVRFPDGKYRTVTLGVPDTLWTIPGHDSRRRAGYVSVDTETGEFVWRFKRKKDPAACSECHEWQGHKSGCATGGTS